MPIPRTLIATAEAPSRWSSWLDDTVLGSVVVVVVVFCSPSSPVGSGDRFVRRTTVTFTKSAVTRYLSGDKESPREREMAIERYRARAAAVAGLLISVGTFVIVAVAILFALSSIGINIAPLLASAGIAGIAIGFGAQTIVRDFLSGVFMILENQYGVGDVVTVNGITGTVEDVGLRITTVRDFDGTVWYVTNGSVTELGNRSQGWSVAVVDVPVGHGADLEHAKAVLVTNRDRASAGRGVGGPDHARRAAWSVSSRSPRPPSRSGSGSTPCTSSRCRSRASSGSAPCGHLRLRASPCRTRRRTPRSSRRARRRQVPCRSRLAYLSQGR